MPQTRRIPRLLPLNQRTDSESMPKIVKPRAFVISWSAQADLPRQVVERSTHCGNLQAAVIAEENKETMRCEGTDRGDGRNRP